MHSNTNFDQLWKLLNHVRVAQSACYDQWRLEFGSEKLVITLTAKSVSSGEEGAEAQAMGDEAPLPGESELVDVSDEDFLAKLSHCGDVLKEESRFLALPEDPAADDTLYDTLRRTRVRRSRLRKLRRLVALVRKVAKTQPVRTGAAALVRRLARLVGTCTLPISKTPCPSKHAAAPAQSKHCALAAATRSSHKGTQTDVVIDKNVGVVRPLHYTSASQSSHLDELNSLASDTAAAAGEIERSSFEERPSANDAASTAVAHPASARAPAANSTHLHMEEPFLPSVFFDACSLYEIYLSNPDLVNHETLDMCLHTMRKYWFSLLKLTAAAQLRMATDFLQTMDTSLRNRLINLYDEGGNTILHYAMSSENFQLIKSLLPYEPDLNAVNKLGYTPLMLAALVRIGDEENKGSKKGGRGGSARSGKGGAARLGAEREVAEEVLMSVLRHPQADVNAQCTSTGQTALMLAASQGAARVVDHLLHTGRCDVNAQDNDGSTALMCAVEHGHKHICRRLLAHPLCDTNLHDADDSTALAVAMARGFKDIAVMIYSRQQKDRLRKNTSAKPLIHIQCTEFAFIQFHVKDVANNQSLGVRMLHFKALQQGYRHLRLHKLENNEPHVFAQLLLKTEIHEVSSGSPEQRDDSFNRNSVELVPTKTTATEGGRRCKSLSNLFAEHKGSGSAVWKSLSDIRHASPPLLASLHPTNTLPIYIYGTVFHETTGNDFVKLQVPTDTNVQNLYSKVMTHLLTSGVPSLLGSARGSLDTLLPLMRSRFALFEETPADGAAGGGDKAAPRRRSMQGHEKVADVKHSWRAGGRIVLLDVLSEA